MSSFRKSNRFDASSFFTSKGKAKTSTSTSLGKTIGALFSRINLVISIPGAFLAPKTLTTSRSIFRGLEDLK